MEVKQSWMVTSRMESERKLQGSEGHCGLRRSQVGRGSPNTLLILHHIHGFVAVAFAVVMYTSEESKLFDLCYT